MSKKANKGTKDAKSAKATEVAKAVKSAKAARTHKEAIAAAPAETAHDEKDAKGNRAKKGAKVVAPPASNEAVHKSMQGNKRRDTKPELVVRRMLREMGYPGYRLDWKKAPGHPDIAYPGRKTCVFVMGCFWHDHEGCKYASKPRTHSEYWEDKFRRNKERDARVRAELEDLGWTVIDIWECELKKDRIEDTRARLEREISYAFINL